MKYITVVKDFVVRDRHFVIVKSEDDWYLAIEDKYIKDGKTTKALNGLNTHAHKDLNLCLNMTKDSVEADYLMAQGYTKAQAFAEVFGLQENIEQLEKIFN